MHQHVSDLLRNGAVVVYTSPRTSVAEATRIMTRHNVSSILVLDAGRLVGIFTERDLLRRVVVENRRPDETRIEEVMTKDVFVVHPDTPRADVLQIMNAKHIRHVPVLDGTALVGVISLRDVLRFENMEKDFEIEQLRQYLFQSPSSGITA